MNIRIQVDDVVAIWTSPQMLLMAAMMLGDSGVLFDDGGDADNDHHAIKEEDEQLADFIDLKPEASTSTARITTDTSITTKDPEAVVAENNNIMTPLIISDRRIDSSIAHNNQNNDGKLRR